MLNSIHKPAADQTLSSYAACLGNIHFGLTDDQKEDFADRIREGNVRNVGLFQDRKTYRVRLYIGGKQRTLGATLCFADAARFADMAVMFFWPYRIRRNCPPTESDMNFSLQQAQHDLDTNEDARQILEFIRDHLQKFGDLPDPAIANAERKQRIAQREQRRTVRGELQSYVKDLQFAVDILPTKLLPLFQQVGAELQTQRQAIEALRTEIAALRAGPPFPDLASFHMAAQIK